MYVLIEICYVCLKDKSNIKRVNDSNAANREILRIFRYFSVNLNWAKTKHNILLCEDCCSKLLELYKFEKMCNKNSKILQDYVSLLNEAGSSNKHVEAHLSVLLVGKSEMNYKVELKIEDDTIIGHQIIAEYVTKSLEFDIKVEKHEKTDAKIVLDGHIVTTDNVTSEFRYEQTDVADPSALAEYINEINYKVNLVTQEDALTDSQQITREVPETLNYEIDIKEETICKSEELDEEYKEIFNEKTDSDIISHDYEDIINSTVGGFIGFTYQEIGTAKEHSVMNKKFHTKRALSGHKRIHSDGNPFCSKLFNYKSNHKCSVCNKQFTKKSYLIIHERTHTGEKPYKCSVCDKSFSSKSNLYTHEFIHTDFRPHKCSVCKKQFTQKAHLIVHERTHTGEKPYKCSVCYKSFISKSDLCRHEYIHTDFKPHKCSVCNKQFIKKSNLIIHESTHIGKRPFKCAICHTYFRAKAFLTAHYRIHSRGK